MQYRPKTPLVKAALLFSSLALFTAGCAGGLVKPKVEDGIRSALPEYIGPAREYTVRVDGSTTGMIGGTIKHLHIEGEDVQIDPRLKVQHMTVDMEHVKFNPSSRKVKSVRSTTFEARVSADEVNRYIERTRGSSDLQVSLEPGKVTVSLAPSLLGVSVGVNVSGKPVIRDGSKIDFVADSASAAHLPVPAFLVNRLIDGFNPVLDLSVMKFPVQLKQIIVERGAVVIKGDAEFGGDR